MQRTLKKKLVNFKITHQVTVEASVETIRSLFEAGYCYYFAKMLEDAFPGGVACLCYPFWSYSLAQQV